MAGIGDFLGMMRQVGDIKKRLAEVQDELGRQTATGEAGGGMVTVSVNGRQELVDLKIEPDAVDPGDTALLEEMIKGAVGQAMARARDLQREAMTKVLGGMPLPPGMTDLLS
jgi:hypothetical protein